MKQKFKFFFKRLWLSFCTSVLPTKKDNLVQLSIKILYCFSLILLVIFFIFVFNYFAAFNAEQKLLTKNKQIFTEYSTNNTNTKALKYFKEQNEDFKGWIQIPNTDLSAPIYQTKDNNYYRKHNQLKNKNKSGSLYFDCNDSVRGYDKNLTIYGSNEKQLFSCLEKYKSIYYYEQYPFFNLYTLKSNDKYIILSVFVINSDKQDDNGYIFDYKKDHFRDDVTFSDWYTELSERSLFTNNISVTKEDQFLSLVTDSQEFNGAKLVITARKIKDEDNFDGLTVSLNKKPRYPQAYYNAKGISNPFNKEKAYVS